MDTVKEFINFISDDPLMLGLCCAIALLIVIFIIVLLFGNKKKEEKLNDGVNDNTASLLAIDANEEPLRSTQEFTLNSIEKEAKLEDTQKVPEVDAVLDMEREKEAPITLNEAMDIKTQMDESLTKDTIQIPVVNESNITPVEVKEEVNEEEIELPTMKSDVKEEVQPSSQPFSSVFVNNDVELPKMDDTFSKTDVIKHIPDMEEETNTPEIQDDAILPKLNTSEETSVLNSLTGETFKIN